MKTMLKSLRRLVVFQQHLLHTSAALCGSNTVTPTLTINPATCLMDEKIHIQVNGLAAHQMVTLTSNVEEGGSKFEARGVFRANQDGKVDNRHDPSLAGTFTEVDEMGLFWSLKQKPGQRPGLRLVKKDVSLPLDCTISVYDGSHGNDTEIPQSPLTSATVHRLFKSPNVRRIPVTEGPYRGTIFLPEGEGPFPGLVDTFGGLVTLIETRAALLASHGYATFALSYLYADHLSKTLMAADPNYFRDAIDWFSQQDYVDADRVGAYGLCYGGCLSLVCAALSPTLKAVVSINGLGIMPDVFTEQNGKARVPLKDKAGKEWPNPDAVYLTEEGAVIKDIYDCDDVLCIPAWQNGAKVLVICGEDDKQVHPKWSQYFVDHWPEMYRDNVELVQYPGAGHLIEPPYSPLCRVVNPGPTRLATIEFMKEEFRENLFMSGGFPKQHALAQEDCWHRTLDFLQKNL